MFLIFQPNDLGRNVFKGAKQFSAALRKKRGIGPANST